MSTRALTQTILDEAVSTTAAAAGCLLERRGDQLVVVAVHPAGSAAVAPGDEVAASGARGYALSSGQPTALVPAPTDESNAGIGGGPGVPANLLVAPGGEGVVVLELIDKQGSAAFTFEDLELAASFASVAAVASEERDGVPTDVAPPAQLGAELAALSERNPLRYREVAHVVEALLGQGG